MTDTSKALSESEVEEISLIDLLQVIVDNLRLLVLGPLIVGLLAFAYTLTITPTFTAKTQFLLPQQQQSAAASMIASLGNLGGLAGAAAGLKNPADQYLAFLNSVSLQDALIERFKLQDRYKTKTKTATRAILTNKTRKIAGKEGLISVEVDDKDPQFAADLANGHVQELVKLLGKMAVTDAQYRRRFFENQLSQAKDKLSVADVALKSTGISSGVLKSNPVSALAIVATLKAQVTAQEVKIGAMRGYLAETAPDFKQALNELANLRSQLIKQENGEPVSTSTSNSQGANVTSDYVTKYREYKYQETLFELFSKQYEIAKVDEAREGAVIQVLDVAEPPERKSKPNKMVIVMIATLSSAFAFLIFFFLRNALRNSGQDAESAQKMSKLKASWWKALGKVK